MGAVACLPTPRQHPNKRKRHTHARKAAPRATGAATRTGEGAYLTLTPTSTRPVLGTKNFARPL